MTTPDALPPKPAGKVILSGIQPSGSIHLGNYLGALKQWVDLQDNNNVYYCIVDLHAITVPYEPEQLRPRILDAAAMLLALGLDPDKSVLFAQSHVPAHTELSWLLATNTPLGDLSRMTQFKEKSAAHKQQASLGLYAYPVLQAADILLYQAEAVPVGEDQVQHIELTRDIAKRFNGRLGETFVLPTAYVPPQTARIMSLTDPTKKMSKSDAEKSYIALTDPTETIKKKISSAVTDTDPIISFDKSGSGARNLLAIYEALSGKERASIESEFSGAGFKELKEAVATAIIENLAPIQERYKELRADEDELAVLLGRGAHQAQQAASQTLAAAKENMGLI